MDIRNIQRTGNMHYVYLPTTWCKEHKITSDTKVAVEVNSDGSLTINPQIEDKKPKELIINIEEDDIEILNKLIVACYINPTSSFRINLGKQLDFSKLLHQKKLISLELVELDKKKITCDSSVTISEPESLLLTMVRKIRNVLIVMSKDYNKELVERYEEEVDRNKMLIDKAIISSLTFKKSTSLKTIDLYYISLIAKDLERLVDHLILLPSKEKGFFDSILPVIDKLKDILPETNNGLGHEEAIEFIKKALALQDYNVKDVDTYYKKRIRQYLVTISEVLIDWAITKKLD